MELRIRKVEDYLGNGVETERDWGAHNSLNDEKSFHWAIAKKITGFTIRLFMSFAAEASADRLQWNVGKNA